MPGSKKVTAVAISTAIEYKDVRSDAVPSLRFKTHRKRYRHADARTLGTVKMADNPWAPRAFNEHQKYWNEKNIFHQNSPTYLYRTPVPKRKPNVDVRSGWVSDEVSRVLYETDEDLLDESPEADSDLDMVEGANPIVGGFENRGELVWDIAFKAAEEKWVDGVLKKEWEVVDDGREDDEDKEFEEDEGFQLL